MYKVKVSYESSDDKGTSRKTREEYLVVNALLPSEAETYVSLQMKGYDDFKILSINECKSEYLRRGDEYDNFFDAIVETIVIDETTAKEKRTKQRFVIPGEGVSDCVSFLEEEIGKWLSDAAILSVKRNGISCVFDVLEKDNNK